MNTKPLSTHILKSGTDLNTYAQFPQEFNLNLEFFSKINKHITDHNVKGLIIGYPLLKGQPVIFINNFLTRTDMPNLLKALLII